MTSYIRKDIELQVDAKFSTQVMYMKYSGGRAVQWRVCSTVEDIQYNGGISSVQWRDIISTVEDFKY